MNINQLLSFLLILSGGISLFGQNSATSNLAFGETYRLEIPRSGVYELSHSYLTQELNISSSDLNVDNIRILSAGEGVVPVRNDVQRYFDPVPIPSLLKAAKMAC